MTRLWSFRGLTTLTAMAALVVSMSPVSAVATTPDGDGQPTADACAKLGFVQARDEEDDSAPANVIVTGSRAPNKQVGAPPPPPPPPPPPMPAPPPIVQARPVLPPSAMAVPSMAIPPVPSPVPQDTEKYPNATSNPIKQVVSDPVSTFSIDVDTASYANVRRFLNDGVAPPKDAVRVEELLNYFDYGYAKPADAAEPFKAYVALAPSPWSKGRQILHIGLQGYDIPRAEQPPLNLVFLIDTSGSMMSPDKLELAKKSLNVLIDQLRPEDRVAMVAYAGSAGAVLAPTDGRSKLKMRCALGALQAGGSTAGGQGLALAYALAEQNFDKKAVNRVILMTDGDFNVGIYDPAKLKDFIVDKRKTGVYLSVYGFGRGNYNDTMMQTLAQNGNGTAGYVDSLEEGRKLFRDDFSGSVFPIANDVKIQVEFNPARVQEYRLIGYETRMLNREDFNNDQVDAGEVGSNISVTALYEITPVGGPSSVDPLRYGQPVKAGVGGELAFLKVRYKLPGLSESKLMTRTVTDADAFGSVDKAPEATRWATAVAGFGQKLRRDPWLDAAFTWDSVGDLAQGARGSDPDGVRAQFVQLVKAAKSTRPINE